MEKMREGFVTQTKQFFCSECGCEITHCDICGRAFYSDTSNVDVVHCGLQKTRHICDVCEKRMNKGD